MDGPSSVIGRDLSETYPEKDCVSNVYASTAVFIMAKKETMSTNVSMDKAVVGVHLFHLTVERLIANLDC